MRESNFAFPAQNRACVCISSQLYDRRALDTTSPLPLFNSLTHLTYLTSTSPRIREILTMDGGLERLRPFDRAAAYRFSLAFQCVVNVGVRGSEPIRARVVQAGTLDVVGCVLEAWLASKGFAVAPSASASGMPRETREQRHARRMALADVRQREVQAVQAEELARALHRQVAGVRRGQDQDQDQDQVRCLRFSCATR
ncbi:hypothetical protein JB92DRAFT_2744621 [Gautieria morchelliformis]|nr:hypothetical protein JB92DRAFT_2744621 [Gautieria morchelliformis]